MSPYRVAARIPERVLEAERPFFPRLGDVVRIVKNPRIPFAGRLGCVQMIFAYYKPFCEYGYWVAFPKRDGLDRGAFVFNIVELEQP